VIHLWDLGAAETRRKGKGAFADLLIEKIKLRVIPMKRGREGRRRGEGLLTRGKKSKKTWGGEKGDDARCSPRKAPDFLY